MRFFIEISYKGTNYHGSQIQKNAISIQEVLENALSTVLKEEVVLTGSSRTDTGVHARQQFFHFDSDIVKDRTKLQFKLNSYLPQDISVLSIRLVKPDSHCRFDATTRAYEYHVSIKKDPFSLEMAHFFHRPLNIDRMNKASGILLKRREFQCFSKVHTDVQHFRCDISQALWKKKEDHLIFYITSNRFLRGMVRAIVGTLLKVGSGDINLGEFQNILRSKDRKQAAAAAPAKGLILTKVKYPSSVFLR